MTSCILDLAELARTEGVRRDVLEARIRALVDEVRLLRPENRRLNDNLTATQTRCTELLEQSRSRTGTRKLELPLRWHLSGAPGANGPAGPSSAPRDPFDPLVGTASDAH